MISPLMARVQGTSTEFRVAVPPTEAAPLTANVQANSRERAFTCERFAVTAEMFPPMAAKPLVLNPEAKAAEPPKLARPETARVHAKSPETPEKSPEKVPPLAASTLVKAKAPTKLVAETSPEKVAPDWPKIEPPTESRVATVAVETFSALVLTNPQVVRV